jgi:predicted ATP-grasp superfamily ATP-dependent carboligase
VVLAVVADLLDYPLEGITCLVVAGLAVYMVAAAVEQVLPGLVLLAETVGLVRTATLL